LVSVSSEAILDAVQDLARSGAYEIQLTAQDVAAWGFDQGESLPDLLQMIAEIPERFAVRLGMMHPASVLRILDPLVEAYESEKIFQFLHLPVQSGSDVILEQMRRGYRVADVIGIVEAFRERYPDMMISSDFITGFPGETNEDFQQTIDLQRRAAFVKVNITRYSRRPGTAAAALKDLPERVRTERSGMLLAEANRTYDHYNESWIGRDTDRRDREERTRVDRLPQPLLPQCHHQRRPPVRFFGESGDHREPAAPRRRRTRVGFSLTETFSSREDQLIYYAGDHRERALPEEGRVPQVHLCPGRCCEDW
jgi:MiaB/RimO family radical SAM methylthiotransferase